MLTWKDASLLTGDEQQHLLLILENLQLLHVGKTSTVEDETLGLSNGHSCLSSPEDAAEAPASPAVELVRSMMPQLSIGFVTDALKFYSEDAEQLMNALMEDNLPPHLVERRRADEAPPPPSEKKRGGSRASSVAPSETPSTVHSEAPNAARDAVFTAPPRPKGGVQPVGPPKRFPAYVDMTKTYQGKKNQTFGMWDEPDMELNEKIMTLFGYDDEYDDTFDEHALPRGLGAEDPESQRLDPFAAHMSRRFAKMVETGDAAHLDPGEDAWSAEEMQRIQEAARLAILEQDKAEEQAEEEDEEDEEEEESDDEEGEGGDAEEGKGKGKGRGKGGKGFVPGRGSHKAKEKNKARIGNHNRKNAAFRKVNQW